MGYNYNKLHLNMKFKYRIIYNSFFWQNHGELISLMNTNQIYTMGNTTQIHTMVTIADIFYHTQSIRNKINLNIFLLTLMTPYYRSTLMTPPSSKSIYSKIAHILTCHDKNQIFRSNNKISYFKVAIMKIK